MKIRFERINERLVDVYGDDKLIKKNVLHHVKSTVDQRGVILFIHAQGESKKFEDFEFENEEVKKEIHTKFTHLG